MFSASAPIAFHLKTFSPDSEDPRFHGGNTRVEAPLPPPAMTHHHEPDSDSRRLRALGDLLARGIRRLDVMTCFIRFQVSPVNLPDAPLSIRARGGCPGRP